MTMRLTKESYQPIYVRLRNDVIKQVKQLQNWIVDLLLNPDAASPRFDELVKR